jgi:hypothetical protein
MRSVTSGSALTRNAMAPFLAGSFATSSSIDGLGMVSPASNASNMQCENLIGITTGIIERFAGSYTDWKIGKADVDV